MQIIHINSRTENISSKICKIKGENPLFLCSSLRGSLSIVWYISFLFYSDINTYLYAQANFNSGVPNLPSPLPWMPLALLLELRLLLPQPNPRKYCLP